MDAQNLNLRCNFHKALSVGGWACNGSFLRRFLLFNRARAGEELRTEPGGRARLRRPTTHRWPTAYLQFPGLVNESTTPAQRSAPAFCPRGSLSTVTLCLISMGTARRSLANAQTYTNAHWYRTIIRNLNLHSTS